MCADLSGDMCIQRFSHIYLSRHDTAQLLNASNAVVAAATVTVTSTSGSVFCNLNCGGTPGVYINAAVWPKVNWLQDYPNGTPTQFAQHFQIGGLTSTGPYTVNFGDGQTSGVLYTSCTVPGVVSGCAVIPVDHFYSSAGTYSAVLLGSSANTLATATFTVEPRYDHSQRGERRHYHDDFRRRHYDFRRDHLLGHRC